MIALPFADGPARLPAAAEPVRRGAELHPRRQGGPQPRGLRRPREPDRPVRGHARLRAGRSSRSPWSTTRRAPSRATRARRSTTSRGCSSTCSTRSPTASTSPGWRRSRTATRCWRSAGARSSTGHRSSPRSTACRSASPTTWRTTATSGPYKKFHDDPFKGTVGFPGFPGFDPVEPHKLLELRQPGRHRHQDDGARARHQPPHRRDQEHPVRGQAGRRRLDAVDVLDPGARPRDARAPTRCCGCSTSRS